MIVTSTGFCWIKSRPKKQKLYDLQEKDDFVYKKKCWCFLEHRKMVPSNDMKNDDGYRVTAFCYDTRKVSILRDNINVVKVILKPPMIKV